MPHQYSVKFEVGVLFLLRVDFKSWFLVVVELEEASGVDVVVGLVFEEFLVAVESLNRCLIL